MTTPSPNEATGSEAVSSPGGPHADFGAASETERRTVGATLRRGTKALTESTTPRLDAELLLGHVLGLSRPAVLAATSDALDAEDEAAFDAAVRRRKLGEPVAYIVGRVQFHDISLEVTPDVLVPRPESEMLVEWALERIASRIGSSRVLDVGTGCGAIGLAIAAGSDAVEVCGTDSSRAALDVAERNAARLGLADRVELRLADLLPQSSEGFDVVVANLPYIGESELADVDPSVLAFEPRAALLAGEDGLREIRRLLRLLPGHLTSRGAAALEIGWRQGPAAMSLAREAFPSARVRLLQDLAGLDRVLVVDTVVASGGPS